MGVLAGNIAIVAGYWGLAFAVSLFLEPYGLFPAPFWPSASLALVVALLGGKRFWPGIFAGSFVANVSLFGAGLWLAAGISITNVAAPALGAELTRRLTGTTRPFFGVRDVAVFTAFGAALHGMVAGIGGAGAMVLAGTLAPDQATAVWARWALSDAGGTFLFAPALILWWSGRSVSLTRAQWLEGTTLAVVTLVCTAAIFLGVDASNTPYAGLPYLLIVPLMWFTVRFSVRAGTTLFSLIAIIAILATVADLGPFHLMGAERPLLSVGLMVVAFGVSTLAVGALVAERQLAEERLCEVNEGLERRVRERTAELHRRATLDSLTGVCNRGHFFELATEAFVGARRQNASMAALLIDLDQLKTINDSLGHGAGDAAIVHVATVTTEVVHESGIVGRLGGDEFAVVLPDMSCEDAAAIAVRLQERLRSDPVHWEGGTLVVSASVGVAALDQDARDIDDLLRRADAAMYASKRGARASCLRA